MRNFWDWFAGYVDGEGTIAVTKKAAQPKYRTYNPQYRAYLSVASTDKTPLELIKANTGVGAVHSYKQKNKKHKNYFVYSISNYKDLKFVVGRLLPLLVNKVEQAGLVYKYVLLRQQKIVFARGNSYTQDEIALYEKIKKLNKRGV